ncbi:MAG: phosphodiesterase [Clostridia bacterium]|nr:phosphodiesterase [Clostridia bacterium]
MKIVIASDIHGSAYYAQKVKDAFEREGGELLVILGDVYNPGPRNPISADYAPMKVADILNSLKDNLLVIKGNCDSEVDTLISEFDFSDFSQIFVDGLKITLTHGHKFNKDNMPANAGDIMCYGHFHTGFITQVGKTVVANAGSVSLPKDGTPSSYLTLDNSVLSLKDIDGKVIDCRTIEK